MITNIFQSNINSSQYHVLLMYSITNIIYIIIIINSFLLCEEHYILRLFWNLHFSWSFNLYIGYNYFRI